MTLLKRSRRDRETAFQPAAILIECCFSQLSAQGIQCCGVSEFPITVAEIDRL